MRLTKLNLGGINLGALAVLTPLMYELKDHLPAKYLWLAPLLVQAANWLQAHKALNAPSPKGASRKKLILAMTVARERNLDACVRAEIMFGKELDQLSNAELDGVIGAIKEEGRRMRHRLAAPADGGRDKTPTE